MLENAKDIIERASESTTKLSFVGFGLYDKHMPALLALIAKKPHIVEIDLTKNCLTETSAKLLSEVTSLKHISIGQNYLHNAGAAVLLSKEHIEFLNVESNGLTSKIAGLIKEREQQGVIVIASDNPDLELDNLDKEGYSALRQSSVVFHQIKEPVVLEEKRLSGAESIEKFGLRRSSQETLDPGSPPTPSSSLDDTARLLSKLPESEYSEVLRKAQEMRTQEALRQKLISSK